MFLLVFLPLFDYREDESDESGYFAKTDPLFEDSLTISFVVHP